MGEAALTPPANGFARFARPLALIALLALFGVAVYYRRTEAWQVWQTFRAGNPRLLAAAMGVQVAYWVTFALMYKVSYRVVGLRSRVRDLLPVWLASLFVNIAAPAAAPAVFLDEAMRRGQSAAKATAGLLVLRLTDFGSLCVFIACGIAAMATRLAVHPWQSPVLAGHCAALLILLGVTAAWTLPLFLARWKPDALVAVLNTVQRLVNRAFHQFKRPQPLSDTWAREQTTQFATSADLALNRPARLLVPTGVASLAHVLDGISLFLVLQAFGINADFFTSLIAFSVCLLYWIVSPTPDGVGFVEGMIAVTLVSIGAASQHQAIAAAIAFRGITLYLPVLIGGVCLGRLATPIKKDAA